MLTAASWLAVVGGWRVWRGNVVRLRPRHRARRGQTDGAEDVSEDIELVLSPQTGRLVTAGRKFSDADVDRDVAPVARVLTEGRADVLGGDAVTFLPSLAAVRAGASLDDARRMDLLEAAWEAGDVDALVAQAEADAPSSLAAFTLAGWLGRRDGDPRAGLWFHRAVMTGNCPSEDLLLTNHTRDLSFAAAFDQWGVREELPCTRASLAVVVASDFLHTGDRDSAYGILLDVEQEARVRVLRALIANELAWWPRALSAVEDVTQGPWASLAALARGVALDRTGQPAAALSSFDDALEAHDDASVGGDVTRAHLLVARARLRMDGTPPAGAWDDMTAVLRDQPRFPGAREALKAL